MIINKVLAEGQYTFKVDLESGKTTNIPVLIENKVTPSKFSKI